MSSVLSGFDAGNLFNDTSASYDYFDASDFPSFSSPVVNWNQPLSIGGMSPSEIYQQDASSFLPLAGSGQQQANPFSGFLSSFSRGILGAAPALGAGAGQMMAGNLRSGAFEAAAAGAAATTQGQARGFAAGVEGERLAAALRNQSIRNAQELGQTSLARQGNAQRYLVANPGRAGILNSRAIYGV